MSALLSYRSGDTMTYMQDSWPSKTVNTENIRGLINKIKAQA